MHRAIYYDVINSLWIEYMRHKDGPDDHHLWTPYGMQELQ